MRYSEQSLPVGVVSAPLASLEADVLVVVAFEGEVPALSALDAAAGERVAAAVAGREFTAKPGTMFTTPCAAPDWRPARLMLVGAGSRGRFDPAELRRAAATVALASRERRWRRLVFALPGVLPVADEAQAAAEGLTLAAHYSGIYKSDEEARPPAIESLVALPESTGATPWRQPSEPPPAGTSSPPAATSRVPWRTNRPMSSRPAPSPRSRCRSGRSRG